MIDGPSSKSIEKVISFYIIALIIVVTTIIASVTLTCNFAKLGDRWQARSP